jgi:predicted dehydrogenase
METTLKSKPQIKSNVRPRLAFVGMGWIGKSRFESLVKKDLIECKGIYDPYLEEMQDDELLCNYDKVENFDDLLQDEDIDGIVIATPNALHVDQCLKALRAGKAVFCQKPLARTAEEVRELINAAAINERLLGVDYSYRFTDGIQKIRSLVNEEKLGKIFAIETAFHNAYGPDKNWFYDMERSGGGCLLDLGCHLVDLTMYLLGFPESQVIKSARFSKGNLLERGQNQVEDFCTAGIRTDSNVDINIGCSWNLCAGKDADIYFKIYGTEGAAIFENVNGSFFDFKTSFCQGTQQEVISSPPEDWAGKAISDWARQLQKSNAFRPDAWQYVSSSELMDQIYGR